MGLTWEQLAAIRAKGLRPNVPVALLSGRWGRVLWDSMLCIRLDAEPRFELLLGLDVWLMTGCGPAKELAKKIQSKRVLSWCETDKTLAKVFGSCSCRI